MKPENALRKLGRYGNTSSWVCLPSAIISVRNLIVWYPDDPKLPPIPTRLSLVKLFLELHQFTQALLVLHGIMSTDDQEVEAWYLEGWCFFMMADQAKESGGKLDDLTWEELAKDSRDCLETCQIVSHIGVFS
jgi:hypothetical protein